MNHNHSFVIPAYKESPYLETCVQHLLKQTVQSNIVIATSTPNSFIEGIAAKYGLPYFINDGIKGIAGDWNFAVSKAATPLVTIAHQDDIYEPGYAENVLAAFETGKQEKVLMAFTGYHDLVNGEIRKSSLNAFVKSILLFPFWFRKKISSNFFKKALLAFGDPIGCPTVTLNMDALKGFTFSTKYSCILDWFAWYELAKTEGSFVYINQPLMLHRIHVESETTNQIKAGIRKQEEKALFTMIWGKHLAKILSAIYAIGHKQNEV